MLNELSFSSMETDLIDPRKGRVESHDSLGCTPLSTMLGIVYSICLSHTDPSIKLAQVSADQITSSKEHQWYRVLLCLADSLLLDRQLGIK